ncbi:MAG: hypothetical protein ACP5VP_04170 [Candidatus Limnocylindrales bacterium]
MAALPPAKFFVNRGVVGSPADRYHLLRPLLRQTVAYAYLRDREVVAHGYGPVERIVIDRPDVSSYFTPLSVCINVDSFEYVEFDTYADGLVTYALVQGNERVLLTYVPAGAETDDPMAGQPTLRLADDAYVQMELGGLRAPGMGGEPDRDAPG